jgi:hypothetical protein
MRLSRIVAAVLVVVVMALAPLAGAAHVDQTWLGGFYDAADHDDVVLAALSIVGDAAAVSVADFGACESGACASPALPERPSLRGAQIVHDRAPPSR